MTSAVQYHTDADMLDIFTEGTADVCIDITHTIAQHLPVSDPQDKALTTLKKHFRTIEGAAQMVNASTIANLAWAIEQMLDHVILGKAPFDPLINTLVPTAAEMIPVLVENIKAQTPHAPEYDTLLAQAHAVTFPAGALRPRLAPVPQRRATDRHPLPETPAAETTAENPAAETADTLKSLADTLAALQTVVVALQDQQAAFDATYQEDIANLNNAIFQLHQDLALHAKNTQRAITIATGAQQTMNTRISAFEDAASLRNETDELETLRTQYHAVDARLATLSQELATVHITHDAHDTTDFLLNPNHITLHNKITYALLGVTALIALIGCVI